MEFVSNVKANPGAFATGIVLGVVVCLVVMWFYNKSAPTTTTNEHYVNTSASLQPGAKSMIANKLAGDPISSHEAFKHNPRRAY